MTEQPSLVPQLSDARRSRMPQTDQIDDPANALANRLAEEMAAAWHKGQHPGADDYLTDHPELAAKPEAAMRLIYEEICQRQEAGQAVATVEVLGRFPQWHAQLAVLLDCHRLLERAPAPAFPEIGESLGGFQLERELGRGALGRVFLATDPGLADRRVVLKITPRDGDEHLSLARLQHTHIVPLYAIYEFPERHLRALCMPYLGGTTLDELLAQLYDTPWQARTGRQLLEALDAAQAGTLDGWSVKGLLRRKLAQESYADVVCWMGACLADALQFAHERGLAHLDIKPSNVLVSSDAMPMLLDFHLAREPVHAGEPLPGAFGGTPGYMSPEQKTVMDAATEGKPAPVAVDGRSDIYSLGLVLYEALGGTAVLLRDKAVLPLRRRNPSVPVGLSDIIRKCLETDPRRRYATAAALADDLRRHLKHWPLRGVWNRSPMERWRKWRRRRPYAVFGFGLAASILLAVLTLSDVASDRVRKAHAALAEGQELYRHHEYGPASNAFSRGQALIDGLPGNGELAEALQNGLDSIQHAHAADGLHALAERLRFGFDLDALPQAQCRQLEEQCSRIWAERKSILHSEGGHLAPATEQRLRADLLDVAVLWADLHVRLAGPQNAAKAHGEALAVLREAQLQLGRNVVLARAVQAHASALGLADEAARAAAAAAGEPPVTAAEWYALGCGLMQANDLAAAMRHLQRAVDLEPHGFWPNFYQGVCAYRLRQFDEAVQAFRVCIALAPDKAPCYYNRGRAYSAQGDEFAGLALSDYDRALRIDSKMSAALLNRGILRRKMGQYSEAQADFEGALAQGGDPATLRYHLALIHWDQKRWDEARKHLQEALRLRPDYAEARVLWEQLSREWHGPSP